MNIFCNNHIFIPRFSGYFTANRNTLSFSLHQGSCIFISSKNGSHHTTIPQNFRLWHFLIISIMRKTIFFIIFSRCRYLLFIHIIRNLRSTASLDCLIKNCSHILSCYRIYQPFPCFTISQITKRRFSTSPLTIFPFDSQCTF